jgi:steroid delta-isomerase-like uncharacterized protein
MVGIIPRAGMRGRMEALEAWYRRYLRRCNEHRFGTLGEFVAEDVVVNGEPQGLADYVAGLEDVVRAFPDSHWALERLLTRDGLIAAQFTDTGTHRGPFLGVPATGRTVTTTELALYRVAEGRIAQVWVAADNLRVLDQLR